MKNLLILIVCAAVYLHFFPEPELQAWIDDKIASAKSGFNSATDTNAKLSTKKVRKDLKQFEEHFLEDEIEYIDELTSDRKTLISFYYAQCSPYKRDFKFQSKNQEKVCRVTGKYSKFF